MLCIELRFLRGRFHATPWGRNVNEGVPEWPPSPLRIARALFDAWRRKRADWPSERVEPLLRALSGRAVTFHLPPARTSHLRLYYRQGSTKESDKSKVFDAFVVVNPGDPAHVGLPSASLSNAQRGDLDELLGLLLYFGRAESLVSARVADRDGPWNCRPADDSDATRDTEVVRVAGLCPPGRQLDVVIPPPKKIGPAHNLGWLDAIGWGSEKMMEHRLSQPPALEWVRYRRGADALAAVPTPRVIQRFIETDTVVLAVDGKVRPRVIESIRVGEEVRRRAMGAHRGVMAGDPRRGSSCFSGKDERGDRRADDHDHASFVAWDRDRDGIIDHVVVTAAQGFDPGEILALHRLTPLTTPRFEHPSKLIPIAVGNRARMFDGCTRFESATPFVPTRHFRHTRDGDLAAWLRTQVARSLRDHSMPEAVGIVALDHLVLDDRRRVRWLEFRRSRKSDSQQLGFGFAIELSRPVCGPFSIGGHAHFGLGLFVPTESYIAAP